jgi:hypothetical protein
VEAGDGGAPGAEEYALAARINALRGPMVR